MSHLLSAQDIENLPVPVISIERVGGNFKQINNDNFTGGKLAANLFQFFNPDNALELTNQKFIRCLTILHRETAP